IFINGVGDFASFKEHMRNTVMRGICRCGDSAGSGTDYGNFKAISHRERATPSSSNLKLREEIMSDHANLIKENIVRRSHWLCNAVSQQSPLNVTVTQSHAKHSSTMRTWIAFALFFIVFVPTHANANPAHRYLGAATCASSNCHGS